MSAEVRGLVAVDADDGVTLSLWVGPAGRRRFIGTLRFDSDDWDDFGTTNSDNNTVTVSVHCVDVVPR